MSENNVHLCKDCKHSFIPIMNYIVFPFLWLEKVTKKTDGDQYFYRCKRLVKEEKTVFNPVTGQRVTKSEYTYCASARESFGPCGTQGLYFTPKGPKQFLTYMKKI